MSAAKDMILEREAREQERQPKLYCGVCCEAFPWDNFTEEVASEQEAWDIIKGTEFVELVCDAHADWHGD